MAAFLLALWIHYPFGLVAAYLDVVGVADCKFHTFHQQVESGSEIELPNKFLIRMKQSTA